MNDADDLAGIAVELAVRVRDHDPADNARWLAKRLPDPGDWFRLAFVLAAAIPDDRSWRALTAWTRTLRLAPEPEPVRALRPHGTLAAAARHRYRREALCDACREASRAYDRGRKRDRRTA